MKYDDLSNECKVIYIENLILFQKHNVCGTYPGTEFEHFMVTLATNNIAINFVPRGTAISPIGRAIRDAGGVPEVVINNMRYCAEYNNLRRILKVDLEAVYLG